MIDIDSFFDSPSDVCLGIAEREKKIRKARHLSQSHLAERSGVSMGSLRRFESTGQISLESLVKIAIALDVNDDMKNLFKERKIYNSIQDVIDEANQER